MNLDPGQLQRRVAALRSDPVLVNSLLIFTTTTMMAAAGAVFWVIAARLQSPENVGLASSLVSASDSLGLFAQLGLNITMLQTMPTSERKAADVAFASMVVGTAGAGLGAAYALMLPVFSPRLTAAIDSPWTVVLFGALVAATAINVLTDSVFLSINRVMLYLKTNGILLGVAKLTLPFLLSGAGAIGIYGSASGAAMMCGVASLVAIFRYVPGRRLRWPSRQLRDARRFTGAGYATYVLNVTPQLVMPLLIINALGTAKGAVFFISVQIITLQNAVTLAVGNSMYAESERTPERRREVVRRGGITIVVCAIATIVVLEPLAPFILRVFGSHYSQNGTATLRVLGLCALSFGFNYWSAMRLRMARNLRAMIAVQLVSTTFVLGLAAVAAPHGTVWVAGAFGVGQMIGGVTGFLVSAFWAPVRDTAPVEHGPVEPVEPVESPEPT